MAGREPGIRRRQESASAHPEGLPRCGVWARRAPSGAAWRRCHLICHWLQDLCSNWSPAGPNPIDDETYGLRADGRPSATATTASRWPVRSQRVQPGRRRCPAVCGPPEELRLKSARERMDIISAHREVGTYRGAAVACGTESRQSVMVFPSPRSRSPA